MSFFAELKRRNVVRVAVAYTVIGWVMAQVAEFAFETFAAPDWVLKAFVVVLILGLPPVLIFAWAFELTPEGIKREKDVDRSKSITTQTGRKIDYTIIAGLVVVAVLVILRPYLPGGAQTAAIEIPDDSNGESVAVLPFVDLSQEGDQEFFADGISEEILNVLVRIPGLKVAGRTSSFSFKGREQDLREIGTALGVNHILEGSVRRSGPRLRITAQLIRGDDGFHLWSETYDREITDIFEIQDDIARAVADQLAVSLGLPSESLVMQKTTDIVAYENYLRAHQLFLKRGRANLDMALLLLTETIARDPGYAPAWAALSRIYSIFDSYQASTPTREQFEQWRALGKAAAERAIQLNPDNAHAHLSRGNFLFMEHNWVEALEAFDRAMALAPDDPSVLDSYAQNLIDAGYHDKAAELAQRAVTLDPLVSMYRNTLGRSYQHLGEYDTAVESFEKAILIDEALPFPYANLVAAAAHNRQADEVVSTIEAARAAGAFPVLEPDPLPVLSMATTDEQALRSRYPEFDFNVRRTISTLLGDADLLIATLEPAWNGDYRPVPLVVSDIDLSLVTDHPRWKEQVRRDGFLGLWRERGFPSWCRPMGDDDFECEIPRRAATD